MRKSKKISFHLISNFLLLYVYAIPFGINFGFDVKKIIEKKFFSRAENLNFNSIPSLFFSLLNLSEFYV